MPSQPARARIPRMNLTQAIKKMTNKTEDYFDDAQATSQFLDDLLRSWHAWCQRYAYGMGYATVNAACRQARTSRQYDDTNGSLDAHIEDSRLEVVDAVINQIDNPWRTALMFQARNLCIGATVWSSPRLPVCQRARIELLVNAREKFQKGLLHAGIF